MRSPESCYWCDPVQDMGATLTFCKLKYKKNTIVDSAVAYTYCENCPDYHSKYKKSEGDKVREMSDSELADLFIEIMRGGCPEPTSECTTNCKKCWIGFLQNEAEGGGRI